MADTVEPLLNTVEGKGIVTQDAAYATTFEGWVELGRYAAPGIHVAGNVVAGDNPLAPRIEGNDVGFASFLGMQVWGEYVLHGRGALKGIGLGGRVDRFDPDTDAADDAFLLWTPLVNLYFGEAFKLQAKVFIVNIPYRGTAPAVNPPIKIGVGQSKGTDPNVTVGRDLTIEPLQSTRVEVMVELPFAAFGTYHVVGSVGEGEIGTTFQTTWGAYPWGLIIFTMFCAALLGLGIYVRVKAERAQRAARMSEETSATLMNRSYGLPDVVYVEHLTSALYLSKQEDVDQYMHVMESIAVRSAPPDRTADIIGKILSEA